ncbi:MAG: ABC transporter ATP-binding protein [Patescibacteria group bacterium]|jgi:ABC-type multidrug transport system fused ATPase/permease subunit
MVLVDTHKLANILKLAHKAFFKYKKKIVILTALGFISGLLESIGVNALIPLFSFATKNKEYGSDLVTDVIEKTFNFLHINFNIRYLLIFVCLMFVLKAVMLIISSYISVRITTDYEKATRSDLYKKTMNSDWPHLIQQKLGYLENTIMTDVQYSANLLQQLSDTIMVITSLLMYILIAINISLYITLITLVLGLCLFFFFKPTMYRIKNNAEKMVQFNKKISHFINESIVGIKTVKATMAGEKLMERAKLFFEELNVYKIKIFLLRNITQSFIQPISLIFICVIFAIYYKSANFNLPSMIAIVYLIQRIFQYIQQLQGRFQSINEAYPYLKNAINFSEASSQHQEQNKGNEPYQFTNQLVFKDVSFSYHENKAVLEKIDFTINKGMMVGLIGPSGAGKTTIVDLILRLYQHESGQILLDGRDIKKIELKQWRKNIGYISQDMFLLNDTIANNIKFYDEAVGPAEIQAAAKMANIDDFVESLPEKYESIIGERGVLLSAGQRQRIVIARVLAKQPEFLILDEATSALDNESEFKIQQVLEKLKGKITIIAIAHRLSTIIESDKLLVLENGKIIEEGKPADLLKAKESYFYKVYNIRN